MSADQTPNDPAMLPAQDTANRTPPRAATEREPRPWSIEAIAERVYQLFCEELRRERERRGGW